MKRTGGFLVFLAVFLSVSLGTTAWGNAQKKIAHHADYQIRKEIIVNCRLNDPFTLPDIRGHAPRCDFKLMKDEKRGHTQKACFVKAEEPVDFKMQGQEVTLVFGRGDRQYTWHCNPSRQKGKNAYDYVCYERLEPKIKYRTTFRKLSGSVPKLSIKMVYKHKPANRPFNLSLDAFEPWI